MPRPPSRRPRLRALACGAVALALLPLAARAEDPPAAEDLWVEKVWEVVHAAPKDCADEEMARRLAALGPEAVPAIFGIYERLEGSFGAAVRREALLAAFRHVPSADVVAFLRKATEGEVSPDRRVAALQALGESAGTGSVDLVLVNAARFDPLALQSPAFGGNVRAALASVLDRDPRGWDSLRRSWAGSDPALRGIVLSAVEDAGSTAGLRFLAGCLATGAETNVAVMHRMLRMPRLVARPLPDEVLAGIRALLRDREAPVRRHAALLLGALHDVPSFEPLLGMLGDADPAVAEGALWSLRRMSGAALPADGDAWTEWLGAERAWRKDDRAKEAALLGSEDVRMVAQTLESLARRRLFAADVASDVARCLRHADPAVRRAACETLGALGAVEALDPLAAALSDADSRVRDLAAAALSSVTGLPAPSDAAAWSRRPR